MSERSDEIPVGLPLSLLLPSVSARVLPEGTGEKPPISATKRLTNASYAHNKKTKAYETSCEYFYSFPMTNNYDRGIYIWSTETGLKTGNDPATLDELNDKWYLNYVDVGGMGSLASTIGGKLTPEQFVDHVFWNTDTLFVAIFDAKELEDNWGVGKMADYVIQKYWLTKTDLIETDGLTYKEISFPPHEGMKDIRMEPVYGTYPVKN